jgi:hypothetical protein
MGLFNEILKRIDAGELKVEDESEVSRVLHKAIPEGHTLSEEEQADCTAFYLGEYAPAADGSWGGYFGPHLTLKNQDGTMADRPSRNVVTEGMIEHWKNRIGDFNNPILKGRYIGLVWDLPKVLWKKANEVLRRPYLEEMLKAVKGGFYARPYIAIRKIHRLAAIAAGYNDSLYFDRIKELILDFETKVADDDKPGLWLFAYNILSTNKRIKPTDEEMETVVGRMETRLTNLSLRDGTGLRPNPWAAEDVAKKLAEYYTKKGDKDGVKRVILSVGKAYEPLFLESAPFQVHGWLERVHQLYLRYFLNDEADDVLRRMREMGDDVLEGLTRSAISVDIPAEVIDDLKEQLLFGTVDEVFQKLFGFFIPNREKAAAEVDVLSKQAMLQFSFRKVIIGEKGRTKAVVDPIEADLEGHVISRILEMIEFQALFLHAVLEEARVKGLITFETVMDFLAKSAVLEPSRKPIIERAVSYYFDGDYIGFIHVIVPQIEQGIRRIVYIKGGSIEVVKDGVYNYRLLDGLLADDIVNEFLGGDMQTYLRVLLTDKRGMNVRNDGLHGLLPIEAFNKAVADRVLHALLVFGMIREEQPKTL